MKCQALFSTKLNKNPAEGGVTRDGIIIIEMNDSHWICRSSSQNDITV